MISSMKNQAKQYNCKSQLRSTSLAILVAAALLSSSLALSSIGIVKALPPQNCVALGGNGGTGGAGGAGGISLGGNSGQGGNGGTGGLGTNGGTGGVGGSG
jgi:hypothetical protein